MLALEILQTCPSQRKFFLMEPIDMDPKNTNIITFKMDDFKTHLSHQLAFHLNTKIVGKNIHRTFLHE